MKMLIIANFHFQNRQFMLIEMAAYDTQVLSKFETYRENGLLHKKSQNKINKARHNRSISNSQDI